MAAEEISERSEVEAAVRSRRERLVSRVREELAAISPERTRRPSLVERYTVCRLPWSAIVRINRYLEVVGRVATVVYFLFIVTLVFGVEWKDVVESTFNDGEPVRGVLAAAIVLPTLLFVALHSITGYGRWRLQRELWRRDVAQMREGIGEVAAAGAEVGDAERP